MTEQMDRDSPQVGSARRIAILAPMPSELAPVVRRLGLHASPADGPVRWRRRIGGIEVVAARTGVGMTAGAAAAEQVLDAVSPDHVFVVGIAGGIGASVGIGDLVRPELVRNLDTGETLRPLPFAAERLDGTLASSDTLLDVGAARRLEREGVVAIDMESAAVGGVCTRRGCPWSVVRAVSDRADDGSTDAAVLDLIDAEGRARPGALLRFLLGRPHRIPQLFRLARGSRLAAHTAARAVSQTLLGGERA